LMSVRSSREDNTPRVLEKSSETSSMNYKIVIKDMEKNMVDMVQEEEEEK
jgi:hypothetical protein